MLLHSLSLHTDNKLKWQLPLVIGLALISLLSVKADAEPRGVDFFSIKSPSAKPQHVSAQKAQSAQQSHTGSASASTSTANSTPWAMMNDHTPIVTWFEKYDDLREKYHPTEGDKVILTRPLMQEAERVQQWTNTANKVSKNYMLLAKAIRTLPAPTNMPEVKEYRDLMADWYQDAAGVYMELIRPRPPARTIEDLQEQLDAVKKRSESLADNIASLKAMDRTLRQQYNVHPAIQDDAIQQFVRSK